LVQLQSGIIRYPNVEKMKARTLEAVDDERVQIENMMEGFGEWCVIQRIRSKGGLNDKIEAPTDVVEDEDGTGTRVAHDDHCCADVMAAFAARHPEKLRKDMAKSGGLIGYEIPMGVTGSASTAPFGSGGRNAAAAGGQNPLAEAQRRQLGSSDLAVGGGAGGSSLISDFIGMNKKK